MVKPSNKSSIKKSLITEITASRGFVHTQVGVGTPKAGHQAWPPACSWLRSAWRTRRPLLRSHKPRSHQPSWKGLKCLHKPLRRVSANCASSFYLHTCQNVPYMTSTPCDRIVGTLLPIESEVWEQTLEGSLLMHLICGCSPSSY